MVFKTWSRFLKSATYIIEKRLLTDFQIKKDGYKGFEVSDAVLVKIDDSNMGTHYKL